MHQDRNPDGLGGFLPGGAGLGRATCVRGDAAVTPVHHPDRHGHQFLDLGRQSALCQGGGTKFVEGAVDLGNGLAQRPVLGPQLVEHMVTVAGSVAVPGLGRSGRRHGCDCIAGFVIAGFRPGVSMPQGALIRPAGLYTIGLLG